MSSEDVYTFRAGDIPLLISVPHDGRRLPADIAVRMTPAATSLPDTDWHVATLYEFCREFGAGMLVAEYSRYVVDLNRPASDAALYDGQVSTGLCPAKTFGGDDLYLDGGSVGSEERARRTEAYWRPYHDRLQRSLDELTRRFGYALLWDAHSIHSQVPSLFDGELPALNLGTDDGRSCPADVLGAVADVARSSTYTAVANGRFRGGYITRHYGRPDEGRYAIQLELAQRCYMDEATLRYDEARAAALTETLRSMLETFMDAAARIRTHGNTG